MTALSPSISQRSAGRFSGLVADGTLRWRSLSSTRPEVLSGVALVLAGLLTDLKA
jgi:hypothetical protein